MKVPVRPGEKEGRTRWSFVLESLAGCWVIALLGFSGYILHFNSQSIGLLFLLVVVTESILCGFWQATIVSLLACACLDYFYYAPILVLSITDPQDWVALGAFEFSALMVSRVSSREQRSSLEARFQRTAMEQLYELSRSTLLINLHEPPGLQLTHLIQRIFSVEAAAIFDTNTGQTAMSGAWSQVEVDLAKECFLTQEEDDDPMTRTSRRLLKNGKETFGAIAIRGDLSLLVTNALASLAAVALDRYASFENESRIEAAHQSERLRAAVLDSLAHEVKTPLTAIQTANAGLCEVGKLNGAQKELVNLIEEEASALNLLCTRLLQTARLEADNLSVGKDEISIGELVTKSLQKQEGRMIDHPVEVEVTEPEVTIKGDIDLLSMALVQYLDNAAKYSPSQSRVTIKAWRSHSEVLISVHNFGPAISMDERERIFHRFYRSEGSKHLADGTGVGLSAVKMAVEAHHGHVWVISDANEGNTFFLSLPQNIRGQQ